MSYSLNILIQYKNKEQLENTSNLDELSKVSDFCFNLMECAVKRKLAIKIYMRDYDYKFLWRDLMKHEMVLDINSNYIFGNVEDILYDDYQGLSTPLILRLTNLQEFISEILESTLIDNLYLYLACDDVLEEYYTEKSCSVKDFAVIFTEIINSQKPFFYRVKFEK